MYFKQKNYFLLNKKEKINIVNFSNIEQLRAFYLLFYDFIKRYHQKLINKNNLQQFKQKSKELYDLKLSIRFENKFRNFLNTYDEIIKNNYSEKYYFKNIKSKFKRSNWYAFKNKLIKLTNKFLNKGYFEWNNHLGKLPIKNRIEKVYNYNDIRFILDQYIEEIKTGFNFEITNFWLKLRNNKNYPKLEKISIKTLKNIISNELGIVFKTNKKYLIKHPKRHYFAKPGLVQMDLKIIGTKDTKMKKKLIIFNMIETRSRFSFSNVLENGSIENVLNALEEGKKFFKNFGIDIKSIQTDNAMMFKGTNFINSNSYYSYLKENKITRRLIPLGVPECNGCIERFHLTIDKKCSTLLSQVENISQAKEVIKKFSDEYNFDRFHYYSELEKINIPYHERYMKPIDAIKLLYNYC